jgi:hypothetical protein
MTDTYASDKPLWHLRLKRFEADDESDRDATEELLAAVDDLTSGWLVPLAIGLSVECCDPANYYTPSAAPPPGRHWFLRVPDLPASLSITTGYSDPVVDTAPRLDGATVARWVAGALDQHCPIAEHLVVFDELTWTAVRVRVPVAGSIRVTFPGGVAPSQLDTVAGVSWALGPMVGPVGAPACLRAVNEHGVTSIDLALFWDLWIDHPAGRALVDAGGARVLARGRGWQMESPLEVEQPTP